MTEPYKLQMSKYLTRRRSQLLAELTAREPDLTRELVSVLGTQERMRAELAMSQEATLQLPAPKA